MRLRRSPRISAAVARRLLDGGDGPTPLPELLAAARAPATTAELRGEEAARAAFRSSLETAPLPHDLVRRPPVKTTTTIMLAKAIAAIALTASTAGGVALATDSRSTPPEGHVAAGGERATTSDTLAADLPAASTTASAAGPQDAARPGTSFAPPGDDSGAKAVRSPSPSAAHPTGLCRAVTNVSAADHPGKAADSPAFTDVTCSDDGTDPAQRTGRPTAPPGNPDQQTGKPDQQAGKVGGDRPDNTGADNRNNNKVAGDNKADNADNVDKKTHGSNADKTGENGSSTDNRDRQGPEAGRSSHG
jgi:hypothetical protein